MTALRDAIDYTTLGWIKPELDETLQQARIEIEAFVDDPTDASRMRFCAGYLHQVQGTLRMVELYAPAMVAEEMERLAQTLQEGATRDRDGACASLMRGALLLPDYLERLQGGHKDIPIVLLPLLNELRAARGAAGLSESVLFAPDLQRPLPADLPQAAPEPDPARGQTGARLAELNAAMAAWPDDGGPADAAAFATTLEALLPQAREEPVRRMLWVASRTMQALRDGAIVADTALRQGFAGVVREARQQLQHDGFGVPSPETALEPTRQLLYHVANNGGEHAALRELRDTFDLDAPAPSEAELDHARGSLRGRNRALLDTVAGAVKEDLLRVKDVLDLHLRTGERSTVALQPQVEALGRVADTLGMLGLGVARTVVQQQREAMEAIVRGDRQADENALLDIAGSLLYVDASLDDQVARLGDGDASDDEDPLVGESRKAGEILAREAIANFADARQAFVAFVETSWDHGELVEVPRLLQEVSGALQMLQLPLPADYLTGVRRYTETELLVRKRVPNGRQLDTLADALASLEYYLEALREQRGNRDDILDIARNSLETLGYWPLPPEQAPVAESADGADVAAAGSGQAAAPEAIAAGVAAFIDRPRAGQEQGTDPAAPTASAAAVRMDGGFEATDEDIDDEIREVFLEEFAEEIDHLDKLLPPWREQPNDMERLRPIRRVFHTLKGSGRLVGARALGDFSWKIESLLNRVLDGSRAATPAVVAMVDQAFQTLPQLQSALRGEAAVEVDLAQMQADAERIAAGDEAPPRPAAVRVAPTAAAPETEEIVAPASDREAQAPDATAGAPGPEIADAPDMVPASVDALLLEILDAEVTGHRATVDAWVARAAAGDSAADDTLLRAVHTMNGAFAMAEVPVVTEALAPAESYIRRMLAAQAVADAEGIAAIGALSTLVGATVAGLKSSRPQVPTCDALAARLATLRDGLPEVRPAPPVVDDDDDGASLAMGPVDAELSALDLSAYGDLAGVAVPEFGRESGEETVAAERGGEAERVEAGHLEAERLEAERVEVERLEAERLEAERLEAERLEAERLEAERLEAERLEAERLETERLEAERLEAERLEAERLEAERLEVERLEAERLEAERLEAERLEAERLEAERLETERLEAERLEAERVEAERLELEAEEEAEYARLEAEYAEQDRLARLEAENAAAAGSGSDADAEVPEPVAEPATPEPEPEPEPAPAATAQADATAAVDPDAPLELADLDTELVDIFVEESGDLLDHADGLLAQLREAPGEREPLVGLQRDLHTIKGGARMAGIMAIGELGHAMESLLESVVEQRCELGSDGIPLLERGFDRLHVMVTRIGERRAVSLSEELSVEFDARARGETPASRAEAESTAAAAPAPAVELAPLSAPIGDDTAGDGDDITVRVPQEQVRIRADLLDRLVNYAGEVAIYRARLEQQLGAFRAAMAEMEQTNTRLRDQLRRLDIETEAQIIARFQREGDSGDASFDPLELDRFSTLQQLSRALAESATDMTSLQGTLDDLTRQYETLLLQQSRVSSDLQEGLMRTRMVPFDALLPRLRRVVRQAAAETGKQVQLKLDGAQGELDRNVLERMTAPLEHMLRNAVVHGLEGPQERRRANKPEEGTVRIAVRREGSEVVLEVGDDGRGLDREAIRRRAEQRGLVRADAVLGNSDLDTMIFEPGFSTADEVSRLAGRGVGMDVVASEVRQLGGTLDIDSRSSEGTRFTLRLPQTLAVTQAVFVRIGETSFAVPIASVRGVGRISRARMEDPHAGYSYGGEEYALHDLGKLVGHAPARADGQLQMPLLLIGAGDLRAAVAVDQIVGNREIVVKPVGPQVASVPGIFGATIMGDGSVVVILDIAPLVRRQVVQPREEGATGASERRQVPLVMVVDDSVTMRKVTGRVLERHNLEVVTAKDGIDALERLDERVPDLMLLDIEMPRMDGYELATQMKADPRLRSVPIVMITSRTGEKHRQRAFEIGVERYLGKPYQENELMRNVLDLLGSGRGDG
nr:Hpt domain-containing protein [Luteimonas suaedae]